ncbi:MAG: helix-turn-helix domain-containing protein, partial [Bacteroidia bacterium]
VENIIFYEGYCPDHSIDKLLPDGAIHIIMDMQDTSKRLFNNNDFEKFQRFKGSYISGQHRSFIHIESTQNSSMMVLRFKVGGAYPFFDGPVSQLNDKVQQLDLLWGNAIHELRRQIISEKTAAGKFRLFTSFLEKKIKDGVKENPALAVAIAQLLKEPFQLTTKDLAKQAGVSQKHLISLFDKHVGLTPKALAMIFRFQQVLKQTEQQQKIDWLQIATDCGYYDQAHFVKDFYNFSGINPSTYPDVKGEYLNYIPIK